jgi:hypothetical protein
MLNNETVIINKKMIIKYEKKNINIYATKNIFFVVYMAMVRYKNNKIIKQ